MRRSRSRPCVGEASSPLPGQIAHDFGGQVRGECGDLQAPNAWYALIVGLIVGQVRGHIRGEPSLAQRLCAGEGRRKISREVGPLGAADLLAVAKAGADDGTEATIRRLAARAAEYDPDALMAAAAAGHDIFKPFYHAVFPRRMRHALGEYYTPGWLAEHVIDQAGYQGDPRRRVLDPSCGSGTFLLSAIRRLRTAGALDASRPTLYRTILDNVVGFDLHPLAVLTARANYLMAIADLLPSGGEPEIPIYQCDAIRGTPEATVAAAGQFDFVVGNPPWIAWDNLPDDDRRATKPLWQHYGLFSLTGNEARHGGGKKDLSMLMLYVSADRYLRMGGRLGMVITQTLFQTKGAGDGFRRFRLGPEGDWLCVLRVDDLVAVKPFGDAANWTSTIVLEKGRPTEYPVPYVKWSPGTRPQTPSESLASEGTGVLPAPRQHHCLAQPIEARRPRSPWIVLPREFSTGLADVIGPSDYTAHLGANSGGANAVYWLEVLGKADGGLRVRNLAEKGRGGMESVEAVIEPDLLYPLVRWGDVARWAARPSAYVLLAQDVGTRTGLDEVRLREACPRTYAYLKPFEPQLTRRAAYRRYQGPERPFYSMYNVGRYTVAPVKVVWRRMDRKIRAAVVEPVDDPWLGRRAIVPQETCVLVACDTPDEAHYLCALLNSATAHLLVSSHSVCGGKGFGTPGMLEYLKLRRFDPADPAHQELAACSHELHGRPEGGMLAGNRGAAGEAVLQERRIDELAGELWGVRTVTSGSH